MRNAALAIAAVRVGAGVALGASPGRFLRWEPSVARSSMPLTLRTVGIRDLAVGLGTLSAVRSGTPQDLRRWLLAGLVSDGLDVAAGAASTRSIGVRGVISAAMAAPMVCIDIYAVTMLRSPT